MPGMSDHIQEKLHDQIAASMHILLRGKSKLSTSNNFWDIKILKNMQSDWSRVFSITTQELDFSQLCGFYILSKGVYHLKPKNHIDGTNHSSKSVLLIFFSEHLGHPWLNKPKENYMIKLWLPWKLKYMQKRNFITQIVSAILKLEKFCNLIGWEHFRI